MSSPSTSHGYFESVSTQLSLSVGSSFEGVAGNSSANASQGISAGVSAVDTGMKAGMALAGAFDAGMESAYVPALAGHGLKGMACLPISKQLDPVLDIDCAMKVNGTRVRADIRLRKVLDRDSKTNEPRRVGYKKI